MMHLARAVERVEGLVRSADLARIERLARRPRRTRPQSRSKRPPA